MPNETTEKIMPTVNDDRGIISNILEKPISHVAIITSKKGSVRANHYHPEHYQYVYLISGKYESVSKDLKEENAEIEKMEVNAGDLAITPPMIAHAMVFKEDSVMLNLTPGDRKPENFGEHTKPYKLV